MPGAIRGGCDARPPVAGSKRPASPARRRLLGSLGLAVGGAALWPSAVLGATDAASGRAALRAPEIDPTSPFAPSPRSLDRGGLLGEVNTVVSRQVQEVGAPAEYARRIGPIAERVDFQAPFEFLVTSYFEREPARRDALLDLYARGPRRAISELGPTFPTPHAEMILSTFACYDVNADRIRVNLGSVPEHEAARVLVHEFWHALPDLRTWDAGTGAIFRATGFWTQRRRPDAVIWDPVDEVNGLPVSPYLLNEAMATRMEVRYAGPLRFERPDLEPADSFLTRLTAAAGAADVMHAYLGSQPVELTELVSRHRAALSEPGAGVRR